MDQQTLLSKIRQRLTGGDLPNEYCEQTWAGPGSGHACSACQLPIEKTDVEIECELPSGGLIHFHRQCFVIWDMERSAAPHPS